MTLWTCAHGSTRELPIQAPHAGLARQLFIPRHSLWAYPAYLTELVLCPVHGRVRYEAVWRQKDGINYWECYRASPAVWRLSSSWKLLFISKLLRYLIGTDKILHGNIKKEAYPSVVFRIQQDWHISGYEKHHIFTSLKNMYRAIVVLFHWHISGLFISQTSHGLVQNGKGCLCTRHIL